MKRKVEKAREAINEVNSDTSVSKDRTRADLVDLRDHIDILIDALDCSDEAEEDAE